MSYVNIGILTFIFCIFVQIWIYFRISICAGVTIIYIYIVSFNCYNCTSFFSYMSFGAWSSWWTKLNHSTYQGFVKQQLNRVTSRVSISIAKLKSPLRASFDFFNDKANKLISLSCLWNLFETIIFWQKLGEQQPRRFNSSWNRTETEWRCTFIKVCLISSSTLQCLYHIFVMHIKTYTLNLKP